MSKYVIVSIFVDCVYTSQNIFSYSEHLNIVFFVPKQLDGIQKRLILLIKK